MMLAHLNTAVNDAGLWQSDPEATETPTFV